MKFSPRGRWIAVAAGDGNCYLYRVHRESSEGGSLTSPQVRSDERVVLAHGHTDEVTCVSYCNGRGHMLVTGGKDNVAVLWSASNGDMLSRLTEGHVRDITSVAFDPSNKFVITASEDRRIIMWDAITSEKVGVLVGRHTSGVNKVMFRPQKPDDSDPSCTLVSVGNDERVLMWRPGGLRWKRIVKADNHRGSKKRKDFKPIRAMACHPTQEWVIFSESCDGRVMSSSVPTKFKGKPTVYLAKMDGSPAFCGSNPLTRRCAARAPEGWTPETGDKKYRKASRLIFSDFAKGKYKNGWQCNGVPTKDNEFTTCAATHKNQHHPPSEMRFFCMECGYNICLACSGVDGHSMSVNSIDISTDGTFACSVADDATCIVWNLQTLQPSSDPKAKDPFEVVPFYRDEQGSAAVSESSFKYHKRAVESVRIAPSDLHFVTSSKTEFLSAVWEVDRIKPNKNPLFLLEGGVGADFVDHTCVVTASKHAVRVYDLEIDVTSGQADVARGASKHGEPVDFLGRSAARDKVCQEYAVDKLGSITTIAVCSKIFTNICAIGDSFGNVMILGLGTEPERAIYEIPGAKWRHHTDSITCMAFNGNGHNLVTGSADMSVRIYSIRIHGSKEELNAVGVRHATVELCYMTAGGINPFPKLGTVPGDIALQCESDAEFVGHMAPVCSVAFSPTGAELYSGDEAGHIIQWWWRADPHVDFSIAALSGDNTLECVTEWMATLQSAFEFPRIGFDIDLALCNTVDIDTGVQLLTMIMAKNCFGGADRDSLFSQLFYADSATDEQHRFLAGAIAGGTNAAPYMKPRSDSEGARSPLEIIFNPDNMNEHSENLKYGTMMLNYWLEMGRSSMYSAACNTTPELLANFLHMSMAVSTVLPVLAAHKIELAKDVLEQWAHEGLSLVTNPYAAYLTSETSPHKFKKLYAHGGTASGEVLDILPDSSATPFGESLLQVHAAGFVTDRTYKRATDNTTFRTEDFRFHVSPTVSAGYVPVVPCVFSLPFDPTRPISDSILHILVANDELFDVVFDDTAGSEFKSSPGIAVLVNFKWRQFARREYMAQFFTYLVQYLCFCVFCYGLVIERQYFTGPPCNMFSEASVNGDWALEPPQCVHQGPSFDDLWNNLTESENSVEYTRWNFAFYITMGSITLFFSVYHLIMMIVQNRDQTCGSFFSASINKNLLDLATYILMAATVVTFLCRSVQAGAVGSVTSVLAGWKFMLSWRGFSTMSHYIRTIIEITRFSYIFLFMMIFFSIGCGWAFMLLFGGWQYLDSVGIEEDGADGANQYELFATFWRTIVTSWDFMVGNTDIETWLDSYYELIAIPLFFFSFMVVLVMLNLVIALMADGYTTVMETQSKAKVIERANIIVGIEKTMRSEMFQDTNKFPIWTHALLMANKNGTPIGDMPAGFQDQVDEKLSTLVESVTAMQAEREKDRAELAAAVAKLEELQQTLRGAVISTGTPKHAAAKGFAI